MTLVLAPSAAKITAFWAKMGAQDLLSAVSALAKREGMNRDNHIGRWSIGQSEPELIHDLSTWAMANAITHVIWTSLPPKFNGQSVSPTSEQVVQYLDGLTGEPRKKAEQYIRMTPAQIQTEYRKDIERHLNWTTH